MRPPELEKYKPFKNAGDSIKPLTLSWEYTESKACHYWNIKPWEFRSLSADHKAELMATYLVERQVEGYYASEQAKRMESKQRDAERNRNANTPRRR